MIANKDEFLPNTPHTGSIGDEDNPWASGHFDEIQVGGSPVASLDSPTFTGLPKGPTASSGTNTTQLATTAFVAAASDLAKQRSNHTGTQLAETISDFNAAVEASPTGLLGHTTGTDTALATGTAAASTATEIREHLDDDDIHFQIDDSAELSDLAVVLSAGKTLALIAEVGEGEADPVNINAVIGAGSLAALNEVSSDEIADEAIETEHLKGGSSVAPEARHFYGTNTVGTIGFHELAPTIPLLATINAEAGQGTLSLVADHGFAIDLGTTSSKAAAGDDDRFPIAGEKAALAGENGTPSSDNKYLTASWVTANEVTPSDVDTGTATDPGVVSAETLKSLFGDIIKPDDVGDGSKLDGDIIDVDFVPTNYTRDASAPTAADTSDLAAHFFGVDNELGTISTRQDGFDTSLILKADASALSALVTTVDGKISLADTQDGTILDGDKIDIDYAPSGYTPVSDGVAEADDVDDLAAHLAGIDSVLVAGAVPDADGDKTIIDYVPDAGTYTPDTGISEATATTHLSAHLAGIAAAYLTPAKALDGTILDGDKIDIDYSPAHYTPTISGVSEADDVDDLAAHLAGINNALGLVVPGSSPVETLIFDIVAEDTRWEDHFPAMGEAMCILRLTGAYNIIGYGVACLDYENNSAIEGSIDFKIRNASDTLVGSSSLSLFINSATNTTKVTNLGSAISATAGFWIEATPQTVDDGFGGSATTPLGLQLTVFVQKTA